MKLTHVFTASVLVAAMGVSVVNAETSNSTMTPEHKKEIEQVIHDYLVTNPDVLIEASQALQQKQQQAMQKEAKSAIAQHAVELSDGTLTVAGNPKGDVTLVEFFDYQCIHCKKMKPVISELINKNPNLRVVYKEFPIFGKESELASKMVIAAAIQSKYLLVQGELLKADGHLDEKKVMAIAEHAGLNMAKLKADMNGKSVADMLSANRKLAEKIHLMGTPAFIVLSTPNGQFKPGSETAFIPGAASAEALQKLINKAAGK
ncbi:MAG: DsbA family protein [Legionellaceae bacterium]|nr:DsbA family protein [Legionellaceae bacterium]